MRIDSFEIVLNSLHNEQLIIDQKLQTLQGLTIHTNRMGAILEVELGEFNRSNWLVRTIDWNGTGRALQAKQANLANSKAQLLVQSNQVSTRQKFLKHRQTSENRVARKFTWTGP